MFVATFDIGLAVGQVWPLNLDLAQHPSLVEVHDGLGVGVLLDDMLALAQFRLVDESHCDLAMVVGIHTWTATLTRTSRKVLTLIHKYQNIKCSHVLPGCSTYPNTLGCT